MKAITHEEMVRLTYLESDTKVTMGQCKSIVNAYLKVISKSLDLGLKVRLPLLGTFYLKYVKAHSRRLCNKFTNNEPQTYFIAEHNKPAFKPSEYWMKKIKEQTEGKAFE